MVRSLSSGNLPQSLSHSERVKTNQVKNFEDAMLSIMAACDVALGMQRTNPTVEVPVSLLCGNAALRKAVWGVLMSYRIEKDAMEAQFLLELKASKDHVLLAFADALASGDYSDLVL